MCCPTCGLVMGHADGCRTAENGSRCRLCGLVGWHWADCPMGDLERIQRDQGRLDRAFSTMAVVAAVLLAGMIVYVATVGLR